MLIMFFFSFSSTPIFSILFSIFLCKPAIQSTRLPRDTYRIHLFYYIHSIFSDDGLIDQPDLREVMRACMVENGMHFDEKEVSDLANALFDDAVKVRVNINYASVQNTLEPLTSLEILS